VRVFAWAGDCNASDSLIGSRGEHQTPTPIPITLQADSLGRDRRPALKYLDTSAIRIFAQPMMWAGNCVVMDVYEWKSNRKLLYLYRRRWKLLPKPARRSQRGPKNESRAAISSRENTPQEIRTSKLRFPAWRGSRLSDRERPYVLTSADEHGHRRGQRLCTGTRTSHSQQAKDTWLSMSNFIVRATD
jgi:hypothetical protein